MAVIEFDQKIQLVLEIQHDDEKMCVPEIDFEDAINDAVETLHSKPNNVKYSESGFFGVRNLSQVTMKFGVQATKAALSQLVSPGSFISIERKRISQISDLPYHSNLMQYNFDEKWPVKHGWFLILPPTHPKAKKFFTDTKPTE